MDRANVGNGQKELLDACVKYESNPGQELAAGIKLATFIQTAKTIRYTIRLRVSLSVMTYLTVPETIATLLNLVSLCLDIAQTDIPM